jgi:hypothetical protein
MQIGCTDFILLCINVHPEDGNLSLKHIREFMLIDGLRFDTSFVHLVVCLCGQYRQDGRNE